MARTYLRLRARRCQHCCQVIGRWAAFLGVVNCKRCVSFLASDRAPRCVPGPAREHFEHGSDIR